MENLAIIESSHEHEVSSTAQYCSLAVSSTLETSLAILMGMETLRHGTTIDRAFKILSKGADPLQGGTGASLSAANGTTHQAEQALPKRCSRQFHVIKDQEFELLCLNGSWSKALSAKCYAGYTAYGTAKKFKKLAAVIHFLFSPIIRFHYTSLERAMIFEIDPDSSSMALRTTEHLPNDRIGITALFKYGSFKGFKARLKENPFKMIQAITGVALGSFFTCTGLGFFI